MNAKAVSLFVLGTLFAAGAVQAYRNADESRRIAKRDSAPTPMTVAQLAANGPGDARYVSLTGYAFDKGDIVVTKWEKADGFFSASLPLRPTGFAPAGAARVVVTVSAKSDAEIAQYLRKTGPIVGSLRNQENTGAMQPAEWSVKGRPTEKCWFVADGEVPRTPANPEIVILLMAGLSAVCLVGGAASMGRRSRPASFELDWQPTSSTVDLHSASFLPSRNPPQPR